jgi:hypothetical protein
MNATLLLGLVLFASGLGLVAPSASRAQTAVPPTAADRVPPLRSQKALDGYLRQHADVETPFDALPPGARERFFRSLYWGGKGLASLDLGLLADELSQPQIEAILQLFGDEIAAFAPRTRLPSGSARASGTREISDLESRYNDFYRILSMQGEVDAATLATRVAEQFDALAEAYTPEMLQRLDHRHLTMLWNAASWSAMLAEGTRYVESMEAVLAEIMRRDPGNPPVQLLHQLRNALLAARRFEDAGRLPQRYPGIEWSRSPEFVDPFADGQAPVRSAWRLSEDNGSLVRQEIGLEGVRLLVSASFNCGFSRNAAEDIARDQVLGPVFEREALWLMLPPGHESIDNAMAWNRRTPRAPARLMYSQEEWSMFPDWQTPVFHVLRDGRVVETVVGWPRGEGSTREPLIAMLRRNGLIDPSASGPPTVFSPEAAPGASTQPTR